ncbi:MAG: histidine phosphatase family protein [Acidimicrobiia bacterium]|nr:histidine phosphatase family protein [Acidimicrobiia bacterium]
MPSVLFLRHGETEWNVERRLQGRLESEMTAAGRRQATAAAQTLPADFARIVASDLRRVRRTAQPYVDRHDVEIRFDQRLRERSWGEWEGRSHDEIAAEIPDWRERGLHPNGYETDDVVWERVAPVVDEFRTMTGPVLCVTHGGVIGVIARRFGGAVPHLGNVEGVWFELDPDRTVVGERCSYDLLTDRA